MKAAMGKAPAGDRIIGGSNAAGVVPWQVSLRNVHSGLDADMKPFEMSEHYCGGTILDAKTILSAAHCFPKGDEGVEGKQIMAGSVNVQDTTTSQRIPMDKIIKNTKFPWASEHMKNDIIIIKLKSPLKFNDKVQPACLPDAASFVKAQASKQMAVLSGWGGLKDQGETPNLLQFLPLPLFPDGKCGGMYDGAFGDSMFCAGYAAGGKDPCQGDSGGPLVMAKSSSDDTAVIVGAVSHGMGKCGEKGAPAIYARVTKYLDWIKANMG
jgi:transmembrane serine protease 9